MMKTVQSLEDLCVPEKHSDFLAAFLNNASKIPNRKKIERLVLFGSCARGNATDKSDIDIVAIGKDIDDDTLWQLYDCAPPYVPGQYVKNDIIAMTNSLFEEHIASFGKIQKYIAKEGVDLSGLLR